MQTRWKHVLFFFQKFEKKIGQTVHANGILDISIQTLRNKLADDDTMSLDVEISSFLTRVIFSKKKSHCVRIYRFMSSD